MKKIDLMHALFKKMASMNIEVIRTNDLKINAILRELKNKDKYPFLENLKFGYNPEGGCWEDAEITGILTDFKISGLLVWTYDPCRGVEYFLKRWKAYSFAALKVELPLPEGFDEFVGDFLGSVKRS